MSEPGAEAFVPTRGLIGPTLRGIRFKPRVTQPARGLAARVPPFMNDVSMSRAGPRALAVGCTQEHQVPSPVAKPKHE